jgi:hypothetical protein
VFVESSQFSASLAGRTGDVCPRNCRLEAYQLFYMGKSRNIALYMTYVLRDCLGVFFGTLLYPAPFYPGLLPFISNGSRSPSLIVTSLSINTTTAKNTAVMLAFYTGAWRQATSTHQTIRSSMRPVHLFSC